MVLLLEDNPLQKLTNPDFLIGATLFFIAATFLLVIAIFYYLYRRKKNYFLKTRIQESFELWISRAILEDYDDDENSSFLIPEDFAQHFKNAAKREYALQELINSKKNLTGEAAKNVVNLYLQLGFKDFSLQKLNSNIWYIKAKGIQELYIMDQQDVLTKIYTLTNNSNEFVRMEAQTGVIHFAGFEGLRFLNVVTYPINDWQQLKLLEQLRSLNRIEMEGLATWLQSDNDTVIAFALRLAEEFQQYHVHEEVANCLQHVNAKIRYLAIKALQRIAIDHTMSILIQHYPKESTLNKLSILHVLSAMASDEEAVFLLSVLEEENDALRLKAALTLGHCCKEGMDILTQKAKLQPQPFEGIFKHVKYELSK